MNYSVEIETVNRELTNREKLLLKDTSNAAPLDKIVDENATEGLVIAPDLIAVLAVHNDKADDKDYKQYLIVDVEGHKFVTGSESFYASLMNIVDEMGNEPFEIEVYKKPSKNYTGRFFLTCSIR